MRWTSSPLVRAGHAFMISLSMVGDHVPERCRRSCARSLTKPIWSAAGQRSDESDDTRAVVGFQVFHFDGDVAAPDGGNLNEILGRLAHVIRERFAERRSEIGQRARQADGRILTVLPISRRSPCWRWRRLSARMAKDTDGSI